jgi:hypothetical protein
MIYMKNRLCIAFFCFVMILSTGAMAVQTKDPLPSWNNGPIKQSILDFVGNITDTSNPQFVPKENRIAVFDNDGTLWVEHPMYTQVLFNQAHPEIQKPGTTVEEYQTCAREWLAQAKARGISDCIPSLFTNLCLKSCNICVIMILRFTLSQEAVKISYDRMQKKAITFHPNMSLGRP